MRCYEHGVWYPIGLTRPRLTATFHPLSILNRAEYKNRPLPFLRSMKAHIPPKSPPRKNRFRRRNVEGRVCWKKHILAQEVPIAPVMNVVVRRRRCIRAGNAFEGLPLGTTKEITQQLRKGIESK